MLQSILGQLNPLIQNSGLTSTESGAIGQLSANAAQGNPYASQIGSFAGNLLNGGGANAQAPNLQSGSFDAASQAHAICERFNGRKQSRARSTARTDPDRCRKFC